MGFNSVFKGLKKVIVKLHITLSLPTLLYANENRTIRTSAEIKYMLKKGQDKIGQFTNQVQRLHRN